MVLSMPPYGSTNTFSSVFLFFPESSSGFSSAFRRARLSSVVGFVGLLVRTSSVSSFVMMRSLVGPYVPPPSPPFLTQLFGVCSLRLQKHRMTMTCGFGDGWQTHLYTFQLRHYLANSLKCVKPGELQGPRFSCRKPIRIQFLCDRCKMHNVAHVRVRARACARARTHTHTHTHARCMKQKDAIVVCCTCAYIYTYT